LSDHGINFLSIGHIGTIGYGFTTCRLNHSHSFQRRCAGTTTTINRATEIINQYFGAASG
jgi:hypothetical protein